MKNLHKMQLHPNAMKSITRLTVTFPQMLTVCRGQKHLANNHSIGRPPIRRSLAEMATGSVGGRAGWHGGALRGTRRGGAA